MKKIAMMASIAVLVLGTTSCVKQKETQTTFRTNEALEAVNVKVQGGARLAFSPRLGLRPHFPPQYPPLLRLHLLRLVDDGVETSKK